MARKPTFGTRTWIFPVAGVLCLVCYCGCADQKQQPPETATAEISGHVTFKGKPVAVGQLTLVTEDGRFASAMITDGAYVMSNAPVGDATVAVTGRTTAVQPGDGDKAKAAHMERVRKNAEREKERKPPEEEPEDPTAVPKKYMLGSTSGLTHEVKPGPQRWDLDLQP
jgi:hypothetical protein